MKKLEIDIATLLISEVSKFTSSSNFFQSPGTCVTLMDYFPAKNKIAVEICHWTSGRFHSLKLRHSLNYFRAHRNNDWDIYVNLQDGIMNNQNCYVNVNYVYKYHCQPPKLSQIKKAWPESLPSLSNVLEKIGEYFNEQEIKEFIPKMKLIETRGTKHNALEMRIGQMNKM